MADALKLLMALSRIEGFVISQTGLSRPEGIGDDLEQAAQLCFKILNETKVEYKRIVKLEAAINETITDNLELADGDDCALIKLKRALEA